MFSPLAESSEITPTSIRLTWSSITTDAQTGGDPVSFYDLQCDLGSSMASWVSVIPESAGLLNSYIHTMSPIFPNGGKINYRLRAKNGVGYGVFSTVSEILADETPGMMYPPSVLVSDITPTSMKVTWPSITDCTLSGRDCPTYYGLEWDQGVSEWVNLTTPALGLINQYTVIFSSVFPSGQPI